MSELSIILSSFFFLNDLLDYVRRTESKYSVLHTFHSCICVNAQSLYHVSADHIAGPVDPMCTVYSNYLLYKNQVHSIWTEDRKAPAMDLILEQSSTHIHDEEIHALS